MAARNRIARGGVGAALVSLLAACGGGGAADSNGVARDLATVAVSPVVAARNSHAGEFAADYLRGTHFRSIVVEVDYPRGRAPSQAVLDLLRERIAQRCVKPEGVSVVLDEAIAPEEFPALIGQGDLDRIEDDHRQTYSEAGTGTAAMYVLFVSGRMSVETYGGEVLGLAYRAGSLALFLDTADQGPNLFVTTEEVAGAALVHEAGHLLGLVNNGVPMVAPHEDTDHPAHDLDPKSIMYWYVQVPRVAPSLGDPEFAQFNAACVADLVAFGGRSDPDVPAPSSATVRVP